MNQDDLSALKEWFSAYTVSFLLCEEEDRRNLELKVRHTHEVCRNMLRIGREEGLPDDELILAEAAALLHDVGRFPQYARYRTFRDGASENHGELGVKVLREQGVLEPLSPRDGELLIYAVKYHNAFHVPALDDTQAVRLISLLRDSDKLDIWRVVVEYYQSPVEKKASAVAIGLPDEPVCSKEALSVLAGGGVVPISMLRNLNDYRLMQLSWVYDLRSGASFRMLLEREYIEGIAAFLPDTDEVKRGIRLVREYAERGAAGVSGRA